jgi:hypothetical protein
MKSRHSTVAILALALFAGLACAVEVQGCLEAAPSQVRLESGPEEGAGLPLPRLVPRRAVWAAWGTAVTERTGPRPKAHSCSMT